MVFRNFLTWFWNPDVWLPPSIDWVDIVPNEEIKYAVPSHLLYAIPLGFCMVFIRYFMERLLFYPLATHLGIGKNHVKSKQSFSFSNNPVLEQGYYKLKSSLSTSKKEFVHKEIEILAKKTDLSIRDVERWMRKRRAKDRLTTGAKFSECCWRFSCYLLSLLMGIYILWDKPWLWDINHCWFNYPHHSVSTDVWWYYLYGSSYYTSLLITLTYDAKRKDFWEMTLHHIATLALLSFSWICNFTRVGTLVLLLHDVVEPFLEASKICKYSKHDQIGDVVSIGFILIWILSRIIVYPVHILNSTLFEASKIIPMFPAYYIFNGMLLLLLILHIFWTYFIVIYVWKAITLKDTTIKDTRSESEDDSSNSSENEED